MIGSLLYISINSRPDIAAAVCILAQKVSCPSKEDLNEVKRVIKYLKGTINYKLPLKCEDKNQLLYGYSDADYGENRIDRKSNSGFIFKLNGAIISWSCKKQQLVSLSSTESEFIALCEAVKEASYIKNILFELNRIQSEPIVLYEDNQSTIRMLKNEIISQRTKHIDIKYHFVKDAITNDKIDIQYCPTETMLADIMTKALPNNIFNKHCKQMKFIQN